MQNQYDGIIERIYKLNNNSLSMKEIKENIYVEQDPNETDFIFYNNCHRDEIVGEIKYDEDDGGKLTVWNYGKLERGNLLLGGFKDPDNPGLIGRFGEGMKLSALALCRKEKKIEKGEEIEIRRNFNIYTNNECWEFRIMPDDEFKVDNKARNCLFWRGTEYTKAEDINKYKDKVTIEVKKITREEWLKIIDNILWLTKKHLESVVESFDENKKKIGEIIMHKEFLSKIYIKDIFIYDTKIDKTDTYYGFNMNCDLNRDRNCVPNLNERNHQTSKILGSILDNYNEDNFTLTKSVNYLNEYKEIPAVIFKQYGDYSGVTRYIPQYIHKSSSYDLLWDVWLKKVTEQLKKKENRYPIHNLAEYEQFKLKNKIHDDSFYPYLYTDRYYEWELLKNGNNKNYISYENRFTNLLNSSKVIEEIPTDIQNIVNEIKEKMKKINNNFSDNIKFKNFNDLDKYCYKKDNTIFFSNAIFKNQDKNAVKKWMFVKCLDIYGINIEVLVEKLNVI